MVKKPNITSIDFLAHLAYLAIRCNRVKLLISITHGHINVTGLILNRKYTISSSVAVENCLMDGLRRRMLGLFGSRTSLALLHTIAKTSPIAGQVLYKINEMNAGSWSTQQQSSITWIREALHMHVLSQIAHHITVCPRFRERLSLEPWDANWCSIDDFGSFVDVLLFSSVRRLYESSAIMLDRAKGGMVAALLCNVKTRSDF
ncbi:hypothetical protein DICVIV_05065 [Dictyocaulus viviparus]|uniref:RUN domain-containing protein n=1 Tax=Dictyocaulus viviparus TaxID=29172 RepID=A0A0D8XYB6_DICVI|nr:hypothetical protein DICVIV_05065 [Dictyocaulus viviparus]